MSLTTLFLVRHGETDWNVEGRIQGHLDVPLNALGLSQAKALGHRLRTMTFDAVYSSDLIRALATAQPGFDDPDSRIARNPRLRERHLGVLQGLTGDEAMARQPAAWKVFKSREPEAALEGGESLGVFSDRILDFLAEALARHEGKRVLCVTHGGALDAAYRHATGMAQDAKRDFPIYNASVNTLLCDGNRWTIDRWGDVSHLPAELTLDDT
ncbi:MAG TPA: histidine phosphatase family protein [Burkholderiales bacterium]|nr:histidine phosphatase family protein [Burkholderiales bacterium]